MIKRLKDIRSNYLWFISASISALFLLLTLAVTGFKGNSDSATTHSANTTPIIDLRCATTGNSATLALEFYLVTAIGKPGSEVIVSIQVDDLISHNFSGHLRENSSTIGYVVVESILEKAMAREVLNGNKAKIRVSSQAQSESFTVDLSLLQPSDNLQKCALTLSARPKS